jgi:hypothetical protein
LNSASWSRAVFLEKSGIVPERHVPRLAGTTAGHHSQLTSELIPRQDQLREGSVLGEVWDGACKIAFHG